MKQYLFGLGAMIVGAGLMFALMHGEVRADGKPEPFVCSTDTSAFVNRLGQGSHHISIIHCKTKNIDCGYDYQTGNISCVKS